jgi:hypothetical protein
MKMKLFSICILMLFVATQTTAQVYTKVMPGYVHFAGDSISLYPLFDKSLHGVKVLHIDNIQSGDSLTQIFYLKKIDVIQEIGKQYLNSNKVVRLFFYRNYLRLWTANTPTGNDLINFNKYQQ